MNNEIWISICLGLPLVICVLLLSLVSIGILQFQMKVARAILTIKDPVEMTAVFMLIFGRYWAEVYKAFLLERRERADKLDHQVEEILKSKEVK